MKDLIYKSLFMATALAVVACSSSDDESANSGSNNTKEDVAINYAASITDLTGLDIAIDKTILEESETVPDDDEDYIENNKFSKTVDIQFNGNTATVSGSVSGVSVTVNQADVTVTSTAKKVEYNITGTTSDGFLKIYSDNKFSLSLNGVSITNPDGAAINIQSKKRSYIIVADGTTNTLTDGTAYNDETQEEDMKATFFSEGKMLFSGKGNLNVYANCKAGIRSDAYIMFRPGCNIYVNATAGNGIKAKDALYIKGGVINVETSAATAKAISSDGPIQIDGGRTTAITTGTAQKDEDGLDASGCAAIKTDSILTVNSGSLLCKSTGAGGKGINADQGITIAKGTLRIVTTGNRYDDGNYTVSSVGIKTDGDMNIGQADIMVRSIGGKGAEGIESKGKLDVNGGKIQVYSYDHAICSSSSEMHINGGYTFAMSTNGHGLHANAAICMNGGIAIGGGSAQEGAGVYTNGNDFSITGGTLIAFGSTLSAPANKGTSQPVAILNTTSATEGSFVTVADSSCLLAFKIPVAYSNGFCMTISSPKLLQGHTYTFSNGAAVTGATDFCGYLTEPVANGGTVWAELTMSNIVNTWNKE